MNRYLVKVTRTIVETREIEVEAKSEEEAEYNARDEARWTDSGLWDEIGSRYEPEVIDTIEIDEEPGDPLDDFNYVGSRHHY